MINEIPEMISWRIRFQTKLLSNQTNIPHLPLFFEYHKYKYLPRVKFEYES